VSEAPLKGESVQSPSPGAPASDVGVYSRVSPADKVRIVDALQEAGAGRIDPASAP